MRHALTDPWTYAATYLIATPIIFRLLAAIQPRD